MKCWSHGAALIHMRRRRQWPRSVSRPVLAGPAWYAPADARGILSAIRTRLPGSVTDVGGKRRAPARSSPLYLWVAAHAARPDRGRSARALTRSVPSERALSERYGVSRMTARHAVETLTREGYVYRSPRRGTFVAEPRLRFSVGSFTRMMAAADRDPGTAVLSAGTLEPDRSVAELLGVPDGGRVHLLQAPAVGGRRADRHREHPCLRRALPRPARPRPHWLPVGDPAGSDTTCTPRRRTRASWP